MVDPFYVFGIIKVFTRGLEKSLCLRIDVLVISLR